MERIADHALLSDCNGSALVSRNGTVTWWCAPRFDSRSSFAALLDPAAGHWSLRPAGASEVSWRYVPGTMVLETTHVTAGGVLRVRDALALGPGGLGNGVPHAIVRVAECTEGRVDVVTEFAPRPEYGLVVPELRRDGDAVIALGGPDRLTLRADAPLELAGGAAVLRHGLGAGERLGLAAGWSAPWEDGPRVDPHGAIDDAVGAWRAWSEEHTGYEGFARDLVARSALVLQALTHTPSGAIVAAPTTSLPEVVGGDANWDYRFAWLRDASLTLHALSVAGCPEEARRTFTWMARAAAGAESGDRLQIVFGVGGERDLSERHLDHLRGYRGSRPVRVGNAAWRQTQLDVPGEILACAEAIGDPEPRLHAFLIAMADIAARRWREPDSGIWEGREGERRYLSSAVMCWVALDRALRMAGALGVDDRTRAHWEGQRRAIREEVLRDGWHDGVGAYTGAFGSDHLDASVLLMPLVGFLPADDPRMQQTVEVVARELGHDGLLRRWTGAEDGAFLTCSFWLADCHARAGDVEEARRVFDHVAGHANDLGLMPEQVEPSSGEMVGNFPQGLSHVGLIGAAWSIDRALRAEGITDRAPLQVAAPVQPARGARARRAR